MDSFTLAKLVLQPRTKEYAHNKLKDIDVSACISDELQEPQSGYNCLHLSVLEDDLELTEHLLKRGADPLKQGTNDGRTPLLAFILDRPYHHNKIIDKLSGILEKHKIVDLLLWEQVEKNKAQNPRCSSGLSHLHVACMVDHHRAVELFLKAGELANQATLDGSTPLHLAVRYSSIGSAKALIYHGADVHLKDSKGRSPLHSLVARQLETIDLINIDHLPFANPLNKELKRLEMMICLILSTRKKSEVNFVDDQGLSALHVACTHREPFMAEDLLKGDVDLDKPVLEGSRSGWTALHFAACCSVDTVKLLLERGADVAIKNADGDTPLDLGARRYSPKVVHSILSTKEEFRKIVLSDGTTNLLELILSMDSCEEFEAFLRNDAFVPTDSPIWPGASVLHLAVSTREDGASYWRRIVVCLARRCSLAAKNLEGKTPVHLAFQLGRASVVDKLLNSATSDEVDADGLSFLHIACALGKIKVVERFVGDKNAQTKRSFRWKGKSVRANSTPLHVAVAFEQREVIEFLLRSGADVYARDELGFTPIHLSSRSMARLFLDTVANLREVTSRDGLTHLHVAASVDDDRAVENLLQNGAKATVTFRPKDKAECSLADYVGQTPLHVAAKRKHLKSASALMQAGADIHAAGSSEYDTPLREAMGSDVEMMKLAMRKLRRDKRARGPIEACGVTLLHFACASFDLRWAQKLLDKRADANARVREDCKGEWRGYSPMHALLASAGRAGVGKVRSLGKMVSLLLKHGADVTAQDGDGFSPVLMAERIAGEEERKERKECKDEEELKKRQEKGSGFMYSIADLLLKSQRSHAVNPATREGSTHFHYACKRNELAIVRKFIASGIDVNHAKRHVWENDGGYTPLHFALAHNSLEVAWLLLEHSADPKATDTSGNTPLHVAVKKNVGDALLMEAMWSVGADVQAKNFFDWTPLDLFLHSDYITSGVMKFFLNHGCTIELEDESNIVGSLLHNADPRDRQDVLRLLFEKCELAERIEDGFNAVYSLVSFAPNPERPDFNWTLDMYLGTIQLFLDVGCEIDQQNRHGPTALHAAVFHSNAPAVEALLLLGADVNVCNRLQKPSCKPDRDSATGLENRVMSALACHVWKMNFAGVSILEDNRKLTDDPWWHLHLDPGMEQRCTDELKKIAQTRITDNWSMNDFLSDRKATIEYQTLSNAERRNVDEVFQSHEELRRKFPEFCGLLMGQYRKATACVEAYWPMRSAVVSMIKLEMPDECCDAFFDCLSTAGWMSRLKAAEAVFDEV